MSDACFSGNQSGLIRLIGGQRSTKMIDFARVPSFNKCMTADDLDELNSSKDDEGGINADTTDTSNSAIVQAIDSLPARLQSQILKRSSTRKSNRLDQSGKIAIDRGLEAAPATALTDREQPHRRSIIQLVRQSCASIRPSEAGFGM